MYLARSLRRFGAYRYGPGAGFLLARGKEAHQPEQAVGTLDELVEAGILYAEFRFEQLPFLRLERRELRFGLRAQHDDFAAFGCGVFFHRIHHIFVCAAFRHVGAIYHFFGGEKVQRVHVGLLLLVELYAPRALAVGKRAIDFLLQLEFVAVLLVAALHRRSRLIHSAG